MDAKEYLAVLSLALSDAAKHGQSVLTALESARTAATALEAELNKPPVPPVPAPSDKPRAFSFVNGKLANVASPYVVHFGAWELTATIADKKAIIDFIAGMNVWNGVTVLVHWKETDVIPKYIRAAGLDWWADTLNKAYTTLSLTDYRAYIGKLVNVYGAVGGVLDDCQNFSNAQMAAMCQPLWDLKVPVIASYGGTVDVAAKHPATVNRTAIAWQLYYKRTGSTTPPAGKQVADMLATRGRCDVANLDAYKEAGIVPTAPEIAAMFAACQAAGIANHMDYAAWNSDGWNWKQAPALVDALIAGMKAFWLARPA